MILAFGGHRYLVEEAARRSLAERGLNMRDVTRLGGEDVTVDKLAPLLAPSLFGDPVVIVDFDGVKVGKDVLDLVANTQGALGVILDPSALATRQKV